MSEYVKSAHDNIYEVKAQTKGYYWLLSEGGSIPFSAPKENYEPYTPLPEKGELWNSKTFSHGVFVIGVNRFAGIDVVTITDGDTGESYYAYSLSYFVDHYEKA